MGSKFVKYLTFAMAIFYMAFGFFIAFTNKLERQIPQRRMLIGCILIGYGIFRATKIIMDIRKYNREGRGFFEQDDSIDQ